MGTRARIGLLTQEDVVRSIYTHWDGYPTHHGPILLEAYDTPEKISALLDLGDLSVLGRNLGEKHDFGNADDDTCDAYGRDRTEENVGAATHDHDRWPDYGQAYEYLFRDNEWFVRDVYEPLRIWRHLREVVDAERAREATAI